MLYLNTRSSARVEGVLCDGLDTTHNFMHGPETTQSLLTTSAMLTYNLDEVAHDRAANNNQSSARLGGGCLTYLRRGPFYDFSEDEVNDDFNSSDPKVESRAGAVLLPHRVPQSQSILTA